MVRWALLLASFLSAVVLSATPLRAEILIGVAGPITGRETWFGEQMERGAAQAVADLNAKGGVLGQPVRLIAADDFCDPEQAVAAAKKLVSDGVVFVAGHFCSGSSIPASEVYEAAGVLMISPGSSNPLLTELGRDNVFRVENRDDQVGRLIADYLVDHWADKKIAILHDNSVWGADISVEIRKYMNRRGTTEALYDTFAPKKTDYSAEIAKLQAAEIDVAFIGGYPSELALMARQARDRGYPVQLLTGQSLGTEEFHLIAGAAAEGVLYTDPPDPRWRAEAAPVVERFRASGFEPEGKTLYTYAAVQVWAQAAEKAGSLELEAMVNALRDHEFDTVLGPIDFDDKGDLAVQNPVWWVWRGGEYMPLEDARGGRVRPSASTARYSRCREEDGGAE
jgi:branched-chain amino acid transport system substrate-binding protein